MKHKVLMLGWEYPPAIAGGLGVASASLAEALSSQVDLHVLTPAWDDLPKKQWLHGVEVESMDAPAYGLTPYPYQTDTEIYWPQPKSSVWQVEPETIEEDTAELPIEPTVQNAEPKTLNPQPSPERSRRTETPNALAEQATAFAAAAVEEAADQDFDIIHAHDWLTALPGMALQEATGKPLILHVHALEYDRSGPGARGWVYQLECEALERADLIIPVSQYMAAVLIEHYGIAASKIEAIPHGAPDVEPYRLESTFGGPIVSFVGRLAAQKNPFQVLDLAEAVLAECEDATFVIAGEGPEREALIHESIRRGLELQVLFTGFLGKEALHNLLAMSDMYFMPSWSEPFGLSAVEAAAFSVPCLLSDRCGAAEILRSAWLVAPDNTAKQAELCLKLLNDDALRAHVGKQLQEEAIAFTWADAAGHIVEAYGRL